MSIGDLVIVNLVGERVRAALAEIVPAHSQDRHAGETATFGHIRREIYPVRSDARLDVEPDPLQFDSGCYVAVTLPVSVDFKVMGHEVQDWTADSRAATVTDSIDSS